MTRRAKKPNMPPPRPPDGLNIARSWLYVGMSTAAALHDRGLPLHLVCQLIEDPNALRLIEHVACGGALLDATPEDDPFDRLLTELYAAAMRKLLAEAHDIVLGDVGDADDDA